jgi:hypothetical protein
MMSEATPGVENRLRLDSHGVSRRDRRRSASVHRAQAYAPREGATFISLQLGEILVQFCQALGKSGVGKVERLKQPGPDLSYPQQVELSFCALADVLRTT